LHEAQAGPSVPRNRSPLNVFSLVFALSIPFWLIGAVTDLRLMPGLSVPVLNFLNSFPWRKKPV
jgi:hypothetical protein